jgi:hypothetical protein
MRTRLLRAILLFGLFAVACAFYVPLRFRTLSGDDFTALGLLSLSRTEGLLRLAFTRNFVGWFRPASLMFVVERAALHGTNAELYFYGNLFLAVMTCWALFRIAERQSQDLALAGALALFLLLHQSQFFLLIALAGIDLVANLVFLAFVALFLRFLKWRTIASYLIACSAYGFLLLWRENFVFAGPVLAAAALLIHPPSQWTSRFRNPATLLGGGCAIGLTLAFTLARAFYLGARSMDVPGAQLGFSPLSVLSSYCIFLLDIPGIYLNEGWFVGIGARDVALPLQVAQAAFFFGNLFLLSAYFLSSKVAPPAKTEAAVLGALVLALLVPAALIHKHDPRYVAPSVAVYLLILAWVIPAVARGRILALVSAALLAGYATFSGLYFRQYIDGLYFVSANKIAQSAKELTVDRLGQSLRGFRLAIPSNEQVDFALHWGDLFRRYLNDPQFEVLHYSSLDELEPNGGKPLLVLACDAGVCRDITALALEARTERDRLRFDVIGHFAAGEISPLTAASTPTGRGVFVGFLGDAVGGHHSLTVVSGYQYRAPLALVERGDQLCMLYRMPYLQSDGASFRIRAINRGETRLLLDAAVTPSSDWAGRCLDLSESGRDVGIEVEVYSPSGDSTADWLTFARFAVLRPLPRPSTPAGK